jgi:hypothetical protein
MTSPDGITWTSRTSANDDNWNSVAYGNGLFVAVAALGTQDRVMTSPNGIDWTSQTPAANNEWRSVTYGNGLFVAVSSTGAGNRVMTSPTLAPSITNFSITPKTYGDAHFTITPPTSNSTGAFSYTSSNTYVATISRNIITIVGPGTSTITAVQAETTNYNSETVTTTFVVNRSTSSNTANIDSGVGFMYFISTEATYANIVNSIEIDEESISSNNNKIIFTTSTDDITIEHSNI